MIVPPEIVSRILAEVAVHTLFELLEQPGTRQFRDAIRYALKHRRRCHRADQIYVAAAFDPTIGFDAGLRAMWVHYSSELVYTTLRGYQITNLFSGVRGHSLDGPRYDSFWFMCRNVKWNTYSMLAIYDVLLEHADLNILSRFARCMSDENRAVLRDKSSRRLPQASIDYIFDLN